MDDVRNLGGRIMFGAVAILFGIAGAIGAWNLAHWLVRHPPDHMGGASTSQPDFFKNASAVLGFVLGGAIGGITIEVIRRWRQRRRHQRSVPRMIVRRRRAG